VRSYLDGFALTTHAELPPRITIESAHAIAESAETLLRTDIPQLSRVTIHTEPFDH
jgi:divalent metal cation (Fe/Co/Zn/Cd) transporter